MQEVGSPIHDFISHDSDSIETITFLFGDMGTYTPYATFYWIQEERRSTIKWILRDIEALDDKSVFVFFTSGTSVMPEVFPRYGMSSSIKLNLLPPTYLTMSASVTMSMFGHHNLGDQIGPTASMGRMAVGSVAFHSASDSKCLAIHHFQHLLDLQNTQNLYYSFDVGVVHFLYMSTETNFLQGSAQYVFDFW